MKRPVQLTNLEDLKGKKILSVSINTFEDVVIILEDRSFVVVEPRGYTEGLLSLGDMTSDGIITSAEYLEIKKAEDKLEKQKKRKETQL